MLFDRNMLENELNKKSLPKPSKIDHRIDREPYQKIDHFLEGLPGALSTNNAIALHQLVRKGRGNGEGLPKTPSSFLGKIGG